MSFQVLIPLERFLLGTSLGALHATADHHGAMHGMRMHDLRTFFCMKGLHA